MPIDANEQLRNYLSTMRATLLEKDNSERDHAADAWEMITDTYKWSVWTVVQPHFQAFMRDYRPTPDNLVRAIDAILDLMLEESQADLLFMRRTGDDFRMEEFCASSRRELVELNNK